MMINLRVIVTLLILSTGRVLFAGALSVDSLTASRDYTPVASRDYPLTSSQSDSLTTSQIDSLTASRQLQEIEIKGTAPRRVLRLSADGCVTLSAPLLGEQPSFMGGNDPIALLRTLPAVSTNNDLQAALSVRGSGTGANTFESDGVRIINPMHMLGLYSAFNSAYYRDFTFRSGRLPATTASATSGVIEAFSCTTPDTLLSGSATVGLIESHGGVHIPLGSRSSLSLGARTTYLNAVFPGLLTLGSSTLRYSFTDLNASFTSQLSHSDLLRVSLFADRDRMSLFSEKFGTKDGNFGWENLAAGATWQHSDITTSIGVSRYKNSFEMEQGGRHLILPAGLTQVTAKAVMPIKEFTFGAEVDYRYSSGQNGFGEAKSAEASLAASWRKLLLRRLTLNLGVRLTAYHCNGYTTVMPLPRVDITYTVTPTLQLFAGYGRYARFDRLIEESVNSLPIDFWSCASKALKPEESHSFELGVSGMEPVTGINFMVELYYRLLRRNSEYTGSLLDLVNSTYNPLDNVMLGNGNAKGVSVTAMRQIGKVRGRVAYNYGRSQLRFAKYGSELFPSAHDRPHDLNVTLSWSAFRNFTLSGAYTYASGTPYTQAKYGYMIGENLICEYFAHNSSRLPAYKRLDLSASYIITGGKRLRHTFNISVYNALANHNVLMRYTSYSISEGIQQLQSVMKSVIPSVSYTFSF